MLMLHEKFRAIAIKYPSVVLCLNESFLEKIEYIRCILGQRPCFIGITGASASGKSTITACLKQMLKIHHPQKEICVINSDNFYKDKSEQVRKYGSFENMIIKGGFSVNVPEAYHLDKLANVLEKLKTEKSVLIPEYKINGTCKVVEDSILINKADYILAEGLFMLRPEVKDKFDLNVFIDIDEKIQRARWFAREQSRCVEQTEAMKLLFEDVYSNYVKYIKPLKKEADIVINGDVSEENMLNVINDILN